VHNGDVWTQGGMCLTFLATEDEDLGLQLGKDGVTWVHAQGVDPPTLGSMGVLERLDDPIDTPMKSHVIWLKKHTRKGCTKEVGAHRSERM
jgi:hypothetical protein